MVRNYKRKTARADISEQAAAEAVKAVLSGTSIRIAACKYGLTPSFVFKRVAAAKKKGLTIAALDDSGNECDDVLDRPSRAKYATRQVFTDCEELLLKQYFERSVELHYGLTSTNAKNLAYEYAMKLNRTVPDAWKKNQCAGKDWFTSFLKRHNLSLRSPENTSYAREFAFNRPNVKKFYDNLGKVFEKYKFPPERIFNLDETGINTVVSAPKVIAITGKKQVGQASSAERGESVTMCAIVSAVGGFIPPIFLFPRVHMKDYFMTNAPEGSLGFANKSGYMTSEMFPKVLQHIAKQTNCTKDRKTLLLIDNHSSHTTLEAIDLARDSGIVLLSFPPHCSHRLQPLDVSVFAPFKSAYRIASNDFLRTNPGKQIAIHNVAQIAKIAFNASFTPQNIQAGFSKPGIWPLNCLAFGDGDFAASAVSERPLQQETSQEKAVQTPGKCAEFDNVPITPEDLRPFPKVDRPATSRAKSSSTVYTDTPEKNKIAEREAEKNAKLVAKEEKKRAAGVKRSLLFPKKSTAPKKIRKPAIIHLSSSDEDDEYLDLDLGNSSDVEGSEASDAEPEELLDSDSLGYGDYVLVKYEKKRFIAFITQVLGNSSLEIKCLRRRGLTKQFTYPIEDDKDIISRSKIEAKLAAQTQKGTNRMKNILTFKYNFNGLNVN